VVAGDWVLNAVDDIGQVSVTILVVTTGPIIVLRVITVEFGSGPGRERDEGGAGIGCEETFLG